MSGSEMPDTFGHTLRATEGLWSNTAEVVMTLKVDPGALGFSVARSTSGDVPLDGLSAFSRGVDDRGLRGGELVRVVARLGVHGEEVPRLKIDRDVGAAQVGGERLLGDELELARDSDGDRVGALVLGEQAVEARRGDLVLGQGLARGPSVLVLQPVKT